MFILSLTPTKTKLLHRTFLRGDEINHLGTGTQLIRRVIDLGLYEDGVRKDRLDNSDMIDQLEARIRAKASMMDEAQRISVQQVEK